MLNQSNYELKRNKKHFSGLLWTNIIVHFSFLIFFSLVGRFDSSESQTILNSSTGVMALATTVTFSVAVVYGVVLFNRLLLNHYIKQAREKTYLFPGGRLSIFWGKVCALCTYFVFNFFPVVLFENFIFYFIVNASRFAMISFLSYFFKVMLIVIFSTLFSLAIILLSQLFGQILQSSNTSVVASVILVSVVGNFVALLYQINNFIIILIILITLMILTIISKILANRIQKDDVIEG